MSTNIHSHVLESWIRKTIKGDELTSKMAQSLGVEDEYTELAEELDVTKIDIDDFSDDNGEAAGDNGFANIISIKPPIEK